MAIEWVSLKNFQQFRKQKIEFCPTVTTLVGGNGAGKSTVLRAVQWAALNRPPRGDYVRHGQQMASVKLRVGEHTIVRGKLPGHQYRVDGNVFHNLKRGDPPRAVSLIVKLDAINFQYQMGLPFWLGESAGKVAADMNRIVDLAMIDRVNKYLAAEKRKWEVAVTVRADDLKAARMRVKELARVPEIKETRDGVRAAADRVVDLTTAYARLADLVAKHADVPPAIKTTAADQLVAKITDITERQDKLMELIETLETLSADLKQREHTCREEKDKLNKMLTDGCPLCGRSLM